MFKFHVMGSIERVSRSLMEGALAEKVHAAEQGIALLRLLTIAAGWISYPLLDKSHGVPWLGYLLLGLSGVYSLVIYLPESYRHRLLLQSATVTTVSDAFFVMLWLYATGGIHSPYFIVTVLSVAGVGLRFTPRETLAAALVYASAYLGLIALQGELLGHGVLVLINVLYIFLSGLLGQAVSRMVLEQLVARLELQKRLQTEERLARSETELAEAQSIAHLGSWVWDATTNEHNWSAELSRILGRTPDQVVVGESFQQNIHPEDRLAFQRLMEAAVRDRQPFHGEYRLLKPSGEVRWIHLKGQVTCDARGEIARMSGTAQDITDFKEMERRLMIADRMAALGTLSGGVAHEINNPLMFISTNLAWLEEGLSTPAARQLPQLEEFKKAVSDARQGAERVRNIVRDLRTFSRVEEARLVPVDVHQGLEFSINVATPEIRTRARLVRELGAVPLVLGDETRLGQVFLNLLVNAAQAIPEGNPEAHAITVRTRVGAPGEVVVQVQDTGSGMPPEVLERIFDPFFTTKPVGVGTGLGLSICHGIITSLGGRISVESTPGRGTTFTVTLPATEVRPAPRPPTPAPIRSGRVRVLLIDDEPMLMASLRRALRADFEVSTSSGSEALSRLLAGEEFDALVCDLSMPDISGMDLYARLQEQRPDQAARMIFLTGGAFTPRAQEFIAGARYWLDKPVDLPRLRTLLGEVVGANAAPRQEETRAH
ncbi:ATP-binding protein [Hyalangium rubrum]|uniref:histidine kinase n=1 Tax=Hyalangium rubrum TaxID=3103134 RepID=A0ABU5H4X6_9BACT|nr:ATP-binding protein [Hyalangium sp. s54d21]MDY7228542.1 ATP-binding protein [Hyalangium sp. s54d21]